MKRQIDRSVGHGFLSDDGYFVPLFIYPKVLLLHNHNSEGLWVGGYLRVSQKKKNRMVPSEGKF